MRATPACRTSSAADVTRRVAPPGHARGSRPGAAKVRARRSTLNHCGLPVAIARVRVSRNPAATRCAAASSWPRARPRNATAVTLPAIAINTITASISISVKPAADRWSLLPVAVITIDTLAAGLAVAAIEDDVVLPVPAGIHVSIRMPEWIVEVGGLRIRAVPRWRVQRLGEQVVQRLGRRTVVQRVGLYVLVELGDADLARIPFAGVDAPRHRTRHDHADDAQQHDHREHFEQGEASGKPGTGNGESGTAGVRQHLSTVPFSLFPLFQESHLLVSESHH